MAQKSRKPAQARRRFPWLPLLLGAAALALIIGGALALGRQPNTATPAQAAGPRLAVDQEKVDFGRVPVNQQVKATFVLQNVGTEPLQIMGAPQVRVVEGC